MKVVTAAGEVIDLGTIETSPTISITDYSRRVTDDYGVTTVVKRDFALRLSARLVLPTEQVDSVQRRLAGLRATAATWVADDQLQSLSVRGFFKDFALDLAVPPLSYCTLNVEGLGGDEPFADPGGDPAPIGQVSTLRLIQPADIADAGLVATSVAETDYPQWSALTSYPLGERVIKAATHRIYESSAAANIGNDPVGASGKWIDIGPTNRWAMFDQALGSITSANDAIEVTLNVGEINAVALLDVVANSVRVRVAGYDRTIAVAAGAVTFLDLPNTAGRVVVTITGLGLISVGTLLLGKLVSLGVTEASPTAGITDYSRKDTDDFGEVTIVERAWAKRMGVAALIRIDAVDMVLGRIASVRAQPSLWIGDDQLDSLTVYGFFKDCSIAVAEGVSKLSLTVEGLSTAGAVAPLKASVDWPDVGDPLGTKPADHADVTGSNTSKDTNAVGGVPAGDVANAIKDDNGSIILARDTKAGLAVAASAIVSATAAIAAAEGEIGAAQSLIDGINSLATAAQARADEAISQVGAAAADATSAKEAAVDAQARADDAIIQVGAVAADATSAKEAAINAGTRADLATSQVASVAATADAANLAAASALSQAQDAMDRIEAAGDEIDEAAAVAAGALTKADQAISQVTAAGGEISSLQALTQSQGAQISSNATTISNAVGDLSLLTQRVSAGSINLTPNGGFENGTFGWILASFAFLSEGFGWGRYLYISAAQSGYSEIVMAETLPFPASPDVTYTGTCDATITSDSPASYCYTDMVFMDDAGNLPGGDSDQYPIYATRDFSADGSGRNALKVTFTAPPGTTRVRQRFVICPAGGTIAGAGCRQFKLERGTRNTPYTQEASVTTAFEAVSALNTQYASISSIVSTQGASITSNATSLSLLGTNVATLTSTVTAQGASISTNANAISSVGSEVASLNSTVAAQGASVTTNTNAISSLNSTVANLSITIGAQGSSISSNASAISNLSGNLATLTQRVSAGSINLTPNGGFENGTSGWNVASFASLREGFGWGRYLYLNANQSGSAEIAMAETMPFAATAGVTYTGTCDGTIASDNPASYCYTDMVFMSDTGDLPGGDSEQFPLHSPRDFSSDGSGRDALKVTWTAPPGTTRVRQRFMICPAGGTITGAGCRQFKLERGTRNTPYTQEASVTTAFEAVSALNTQYASLSSIVSTQGASITSNASALSSLGTNVATLTTTVTAQGASISTNANAISSVGSQVASLNSTVAAQGASVTTNTNAISSLNSTVANLSITIGAQGSSISSNASAISNLSGNLATLTQRVSAGSINLTPNGGFENGTSGWNVASFASLREGFGWGRYLYLNANQSGSAEIAMAETLPFAATANVTYTGTCDATITSDNPASYCYTDMVFMSDTGDLPGGDSDQFPLHSPRDFSSDGSGRDALKVTWTAPPGTTRVRQRFMICPAGGTITGAGCRQFKLERGTRNTPYTQEASVTTAFEAVSALNTQYASLSSIVSTQGASITSNASALSSLGTNVATLTSTVTAQGASISTNANAISSVGSQVASLNSTVAAQGASVTTNTNAISSLDSTVANLSITIGAQGSSISSNASAISNLSGNLATLTQRVSAGNPNLTPNGGFENGTSGWNVASFASLSDGAGWGKHLYTNASRSGSAEITMAETLPFAATANVTYTGTCDATITSDNPASYCYTDMVFMSDTGDLPGGDSDQFPIHATRDFSSDGSNRDALKVTWTAPPGTTRVRQRFVICPAGGTITGAGCRQFKLERGSRNTTFSQEASVTTAFQAVSTLNTQYASLSSIVSTQGSSITANASALSSLGTNVATLTSTVTAQGASISSNASAISNLGVDVASLTSTVAAQGASISSNASAISGIGSSLASLTTRVSATAPNLLSNSTFENGLSGWGQDASVWSVNGGVNPAGTYAFCVANGAHTLFQDFSLAGFDLAGQQMTLSADFSLNTGDGVAYVRMQFLAANDAVLADPADGSKPLHEDFAQTLDQRRRVTAPVPAGTVKIRAIVAFYGVTTMGQVAVRQVKLERSAVMTPYTQEASIVTSYKALNTLDTQYASLSSIVSTQGASITSNASALSSLGTNVATLTTTVSSHNAAIITNASAISSLNSSLSSLTTTVSAQGAQISNNAQALSTVNTNLATLTSRVGAGSPNLIPNGGFENGTRLWSVMGGALFTVNSWGAYVYLGAPYSGGPVILAQSDPFRADADFTYTVTCDAHILSNTVASYCYVDMQFLNDAGTTVPGGDSGESPLHANANFRSDGGNRDALKTTFTAPPGTTRCVVRFIIDAAGGTISAAGCRLFKMEQGTVATAYSPEASITQTFKALSTLDTQYASLSSIVSTQGASITSNSSALSSLGTNVANLSSTVTAQGASISQNAQAISQTNSTVANLTSTVSAQGVSITQTFTAIGAAQGGVNQALGRAAVRVGANGKVVGWEIANNGQTGDMNVDVDHFIVGDRKIFQVDTTTGEVSADDLIVRRVRAQSIETNALVDHSVTGFIAIEGWSGSVDSGASPSYSDPLAITTMGGVVRVDVSFDASINSGTGTQFYGQLLRDGSAITRPYRLNVSAAASGVPLFFTIVDTPPAGPHTYKMVFGRTASGSSLLSYNNGQTYAQEFKK